MTKNADQNQKTTVTGASLTLQHTHLAAVVVGAVVETSSVLMMAATAVDSSSQHHSTQQQLLFCGSGAHIIFTLLQTRSSRSW